MIGLSYAAFFFFLEGITLLVLSLWLDSKAPLNRIASLIGFLAAIWGFCLVFALAADSSASALFFFRLSTIGGFWINLAIAWLLWTMVGTSRQLTATVLLPFCLFATILYTNNAMNGFFVTGVRFGPWGNVAIQAKGTSWFTASDALFLGLYLICAFSLGRSLFAIRSQRERHLAKVALGGLVLTLPIVLLLNYSGDTFVLPNVEFVPGIFLIALMAYLIFRYRYLRQTMPRLEVGFSQALRDPAFLLDRNGAILGPNQAGTDYLSPLARADFVGKDFADFLDDSVAFRRRWQGAKHPGEPPPLESSLLKSFSPHYDRFGDFLGALVLLPSKLDLSTNLDNVLSEREQEIFDLLVQGEKYRDIAIRLFIAPGTVKRHVHNILKKTGHTDRKALFRSFGSHPR